MANELDPRIVKVSIEVNGKLKTYTDPIMLAAEGTKFANSNQNECEIKIANIDKATADYILTTTSPYNLNRTPKSVIVEAGRQSYGTTKIYSGNIISSSISQPPDTVITLKCLTGNFQKGNIISRTQSGNASLSDISGQIAKDLDLRLDFQAQDKSISNYNYTGGALKQVDKLNEAGLINAYIDDDSLVVKEASLPLINSERELSLENGMVGIPEITEQGIKVKYLLDNISKVGGGLKVTSSIYPAANGEYVIYKLSFEIANRDEPFYYIAEGKRRL